MNFVDTDLQKKNNKLDMRVDMDDSVFQRILDMISNSELYFFHRLLLRMKE